MQNAHLILWKQEWLKVKWWKRCTNCNKTGVAISMSQKVDFKPRYANWIKEFSFEYINYTPLIKIFYGTNLKFKKRENRDTTLKLTWQSEKGNRQNHNQNGGYYQIFFNSMPGPNMQRSKEDSVDVQQHSQHI